MPQERPVLEYVMALAGAFGSGVQGPHQPFFDLSDRERLPAAERRLRVSSYPLPAVPYLRLRATLTAREPARLPPAGAGGVRVEPFEAEAGLPPAMERKQRHSCDKLITAHGGGVAKLHPDAELELLDAGVYYDEQKPGLGGEFSRALQTGVWI